ncbi:uncharacterized protein LOC114336834 [Diabrotica virgifera virgifera]|uniref:Uncharacterized protein LOC114336834 n=1 Tax=Diabrotica virgifera virgifera TaxID=50390 RepID=A0A6P7G238_DIAVI|nr:uncharacterized protein LOC114336834 [Diabrotica virgifera virgifera]
MKKFMFGFAVFVVVLAITKESIADTNKDQKFLEALEKMHESYNTCEKEFGQQPGYVAVEGHNNIKKEDEEKVAAFTLCFLSKLGLISKNGDIIEDGVRSFLTDFLGDTDREKELVQKVLTICKPLVESQLIPQYKALAFQQCKDKHIKPDH